MRAVDRSRLRRRVVTAAAEIGQTDVTPVGRPVYVYRHSGG